MHLRNLYRRKEYFLLFAAMLFLISVFELHSQSSPVYYQHYNYEQFVNPAITGRDLSPFAIISHKRYWMRTDDPPSTTCIAGSFRLGQYDFYTPKKMLNKGSFLSKSRMGLGALLMYEQNGPLKIIYSSFNYAYFIPLNKNRTKELSFGLSMQISHYDIDENMLDPSDPGDPELQNTDKLPIVPDGSFGLYYHSKQFYIGASANELFASQYPIEDKNVLHNRQDFFFQTGYKFFLKYIDIEPSFFSGIINDEPFYYFGQVKAYYQNYNWIAVGYKSTKALIFSVGFRIRRMHIAYAYDQNISKMSSYFSSAHEIMFGINIGLFEPEGIKKTIKRGR